MFAALYKLYGEMTLAPDSFSMAFWQARRDIVKDEARGFFFFFFPEFFDHGTFTLPSKEV